MTIREIELDNFRIYKGKNKIELSPDGNKNLIIVSGNNGFGKTTFLMSLVWCLYGKNMGKVDELYRKEIDEKGGYSKYIGNSLNFAAQKEGETRFSVSVTFTDVEIPDTPCTEITIVRSYDSATNCDDELEILIDGRKNDLFTGSKEEVAKEEEIFIRDYILPIEIAKFFFFDAEKIVSFAQINTPEQRRDLSLAYSQVLGIQKYEDLKNELVRIQDDYRKASAKPQEKQEFNGLIADIDFKESEINRLTEEIANLEESRAIERHNSAELQSKLIREGDMMSADELVRLNNRKTELDTVLKEADDSLKDLYSLIPFGLAGGLMAELSSQLETEKAYKQNKLQLEGVNDKTDIILGDIEEAKRKLPFPIDIKARNFYESQIRQLIKKHFYNVSDESKFEHFSTLHDFSQGQIEEFMRIIVKIKESKSSFENLINKYTKAKAELYTIEKNIREAEKKAESDYVQNLRIRKERIDRQIDSIGEDIGKKQNEIEILRNQVVAHKKQKEILSKKINVSEQNRAVGHRQRQNQFTAADAVAVPSPRHPDAVDGTLCHDEGSQPERGKCRSRQRSRQPDVDQRHTDRAERHRQNQPSPGGRQSDHAPGSSLAIGIDSTIESSTFSTLCHSPWWRNRSVIRWANTTLTIERTSRGVT